MIGFVTRLNGIEKGTGIMSWCHFSLLLSQGSPTLALLKFWAEKFLVVDTVLYIVGCVAAPLAFNYRMLVSSTPGGTTKNISRCSQMSPGGQNHPRLKITVLLSLALSAPTTLTHACTIALWRGSFLTKVIICIDGMCMLSDYRRNSSINASKIYC